MRVLVCAATTHEANACKKGFSQFPNFELLKTGVGFSNARRTLENRLAKGPKPDVIISTGLAGALGSAIPLLTWVTDVSLHQIDENGILKKVSEPDPIFKFRSEMAVPCHIVTTPKLLTHKSLLSSQIQAELTGLIAVDMESAVLAEIARQHRISFLVLRLISDNASYPLPAFISSVSDIMAETQLSLRVKASVQVAKRALRNPSDVVKVLKNSSEWNASLRSGWKAFAKKLNYF